MSLLYPTYLSGHATNPYIQHHNASPPEPGMGPPPDTTPAQLPQPFLPIKATSADPMMEPDEYGAELGKEARVWKAYVKESDRSDTEMVDGWNKSLDVILVFAALFSAISTAFLIESSKKLQQDPADVTAQTLLTISHTLSAIANGTRPLVLEPLAGGNTEEFTPSRTMVAINTLWYLSLSLSVATSLLAMLAKDWCHSFMAGRTGHAYNQTLRRQRKWTMIEKWKMQELIVVLPSLIHLSLLLFAVGLCIYVLEMNMSAGVPVICVTGLAVCFYVWSSLTASVVEHFPYTTVVSRFLRSDWAKHTLILRLLLWCCSLVLSSCAKLVKGLSKAHNRIQVAFSPLVRRSKQRRILLARKTSSTLQRIYYANTFSWFKPLDDRLGVWYKALRDWAENTEKALNSPAAKAIHAEKIADTGTVLSLALHWIIETCEAPYVVDAALQAIAGAGPQIHRGPLARCKAALEISKRLASRNVYSATDTHGVSLYVRALSIIGLNRSEDTSAGSGGKGTGELQVTIWSLQEQYEDRVAQLIADGTFEPAGQNIEALRLGSSIATHSLQNINGFTQGNTVSEEICHLIEGHCLDEGRMHPAALQALMNATEMLSVCLIDRSVCLRLIIAIVALAYDGDITESAEPHILSKETLIKCAYLLACNLSERDKSPTHSQLKFAETMIGYITEDGGKSRSDQMRHVFSQVYGGLSPQGTDGTSSQSKCGASAVVQSKNSMQLIGFLPRSRVLMRQRFHMSMAYLWRRLTEIDETQPAEAHQFVAESIIYSTKDSQIEHSSLFLLCLPFPKLSVELVQSLENCNTIPILDHISIHSSKDSQMLATCLLWLLCALVSYAEPGAEEIRDRLDAQLRRCTAWGDRAAMKRALEYKLVSPWLSQPELDFEDIDYISSSGQLYLFRVVECVVEAGDHITPCTKVAAGEELAYFKERLKYWMKLRPTTVHDANSAEPAATQLHTRDGWSTANTLVLKDVVMKGVLRSAAQRHVFLFWLGARAYQLSWLWDLPPAIPLLMVWYSH
ncbi:hypothetical protein RSOLAG1IB_10110 [Rhizoctonia solani AG-1 IB]|uniref:DUF6535 domain-containing protein n=1 Tax=Thanatephorus cucumeris (strain AG1-IB / isolate 7/3/14) TaxID=1108050 RepID=A0A0B7FZD4_THACB|nr:hypothetical protein RSOLAG1IB_10110 [Rhizoctonia solani AG-1 IB]